MTETKQLTEKEMDALREVHIPITLRGLVMGWKKMFHDAPLLRRSIAAFKGVKLTEDQMEAMKTEFDRDSPSTRYERNLYDQVSDGLQNLPEKKQEEIYLSLKEKFDAAAAAQAQTHPAAPQKKKGVFNKL